MKKITCIQNYVIDKLIDTIIEKLKPYDVAISTVGFY